MDQFTIDKQLSFDDLRSLQEKGVKVVLSKGALNRIVKCREYLNEKIRNSNSPLYGINTGFGALCNTRIHEKDLEMLQHNLLVSHACGTGERVPDDIVRLMLILKVQSLAQGNSGVQPETVQRLLDF